MSPSPAAAICRKEPPIVTSAGGPRAPGAWDKTLVFSIGLIACSALAWTYALWPGSVPHDTLHLLKQVQNGIWTDYFPILNGILIRLLVVPFDSLAPYSIAQLAFCLGATAYILICLRRLGAPAISIILASIFIASSISVGAYWITAFKDIPCSFAIVALSCLVFSAWLTRRIDITLGFILYYSIFLAVGALLRHGWQTLLVAVPVFLVIPVWKTITRRELLVLFGIPALLFIAFQLVAPRYLGVANELRHMTIIRTGMFIQPFVAIVSAREGYSAPNKGIDEALLREIFVDPATAPNAYNAFHHNPLLLSFRETIDPAIPARLARRVLVLCAWNVGLCARDRVAMLFGTLQASATTFATVYYNLANPRHAAALTGPLEYMTTLIERYHIARAPYPGQTYARQLLDWAESPSVKPLVWNAIPQFVLIAMALFLFGSFPATFAACCILGLILLLQSAVIPANDFRYVFFVYLGGIFVIPMMLAERRRRKSAL